MRRAAGLISANSVAVVHTMLAQMTLADWSAPLRLIGQYQRKDFMQATAIMTKDVAIAKPTTSTREIARLLLERGISAVPIVDDDGKVLGMVSEGDLLHHGHDATTEARRDWWLTLLAEGEELHHEFIANLKSPGEVARDVMTTDVITVDETAEAVEIARLLSWHKIKRVPVVRHGKLVGIVSRADLLRAFASEREPRAAITPQPSVYDHVGGARSDIPQGSERSSSQKGETETTQLERLTAGQFRQLVTDYGRQEAVRRDTAQRARAAQRRQLTQILSAEHLSDKEWQSLLEQARTAAEHGAKEFMLLRFPSELCSDSGRAINMPSPDWPNSLRGEAEDIYHRWKNELKSSGFHLRARIIDFPGGKLGDAGLFLSWEQ